MELTSAESILARRFTHKNIVAPNFALRFWTKLDAMLLAPFNIEETIGLDGIWIEVDCRTPAGSANFEVWSPESTTHAGRLVGLIYDIAWEASVWSGRPMISGAIRSQARRSTKPLKKKP